MFYLSYLNKWYCNTLSIAFEEYLSFDVNILWFQMTWLCFKIKFLVIFDAFQIKKNHKVQKLKILGKNTPKKNSASFLKHVERQTIASKLAHINAKI